MTPRQNLIIYTWLLIGTLLFITTFVIAWNTTEDIRENLWQNSYLPSIKSSLI